MNTTRADPKVRKTKASFTKHAADETRSVQSMRSARSRASAVQHKRKLDFVPDDDEPVARFG